MKKLIPISMLAMALCLALPACGGDDDDDDDAGGGSDITCRTMCIQCYADPLGYNSPAECMNDDEGGGCNICVKEFNKVLSCAAKYGYTDCQYLEGGSKEEDPTYIKDMENHCQKEALSYVQCRMNNL